MSTIAESPGATVAVLWAQQVSGAGTVGVIRNETCFRKFLSPGCINLKNLFAHDPEEILRKSSFISKDCLFERAITWLKII